MTSTNESICRNALTHLNRGDVEGYRSTLYAPSIQLHGYAPHALDYAGIKAFYEGILAAFPDFDVEVVDATNDADALTVRVHCTGTHRGDFQGVPATGRPIVFEAITILRFADGRCVERWSCADFLSVMVQIGAIPAPTAA